MSGGKRLERRDRRRTFGWARSALLVVGTGLTTCTVVASLATPASALARTRASDIVAAHNFAKLFALRDHAKTALLASGRDCGTKALSQAKKYLSPQLAARVNQLDALIGQTNAAPHLTASDRSTLLQDLNGELSGIKALQAQAGSSNTCSQLRSITNQMVVGFRVYRVMTPETTLTISADHETYTEGQIAASETNISGAIAKAQRAGKNVAAAQTTLNEGRTQLSDAQSSTSGLSVTLLQQTPSGYPNNARVFSKAKAAEASARSDLRAAQDDNDQIIRLIG